MRLIRTGLPPRRLGAKHVTEGRGYACLRPSNLRESARAEACGSGESARAEARGSGESVRSEVCGSPTGNGRCFGRGFTLVEMIVVITIIAVLVAVVLPGVNTMWEGRKLADSETAVRGLLMTARAKALRPSGMDSGLFFFIDNRNRQRIVPIEQNPEHAGDVAWENVFRVTADREYSLPPPIRVVPRYAVNDGDNDDPRILGEDELANNVLGETVADSNNVQSHRNFFSMVFSSDGHLQVWRDVLIKDDDIDENGIGDITGLDVGGPNENEPEATVIRYYLQDEDNAAARMDRLAISDATAQAIPFLVNDSMEEPENAFNFPSVDGLLVYDDSVFNSLTVAEEKRHFLLESAQPFYINRNTGAVIRGPRGENVP
ncbi:MAG: type II secretion system GspH family protein [Planctomycetes bacterium]|nr:type II secretion system GspH family protein [Planctomycetota bacterium]